MASVDCRVLQNEDLNELILCGLNDLWSERVDPPVFKTLKGSPKRVLGVGIGTVSGCLYDGCYNVSCFSWKLAKHARGNLSHY